MSAPYPTLIYLKAIENVILEGPKFIGDRALRNSGGSLLWPLAIRTHETEEKLNNICVYKLN